MPARLIEMIGYWAKDNAGNPSHAAGCPDPRDVTGHWRESDRTAVLKHLRSGVPCRVYLGQSDCLFCEASIGNKEYTDGEWAWPEGLEHYVSQHDVMLPGEFVRSALRARTLSSGLKAEIGEPQVYLEAGAGPPIPVNAEIPPNVDLRFGAWLDWAAANTPARPGPQAIPLAEARRIAADLSHSTWQATIDAVHGRWRIGFEPDGDRVYLQACSEETLIRCLHGRRPSDPEAILDSDTANQIAAGFDGEWGAARILATAPGAWFIWVKPQTAEWPTSDELNKQISGSLELGWATSHPNNSKSYATKEMDEFSWRQTLERLRTDG